jgi:hypothetical protein
MQKLFLSLFACVLSLPMAAGTITLAPSTPSVNVGQSFTVNVVYSGLPADDELLAFGFNLFLSPNLQLDGFSVDPAFNNASGPEAQVAGFAFPGVTGDPITLAVLNLTALQPGAGSISVSGDYDESFLGLYFLFNEDGESINGSTTVQINGSSEIPEPSTALLLLLGAPALLLRRRA